MNTVSDLFRPRLFQGEYRITSVRILRSRTDQQFLQMQMEDSSGFITAYAWEGQYDGPWEISNMDIVQGNGRTRFHQGQWVADLRMVAISDQPSIPSTSLLPFSLAPAQKLLIKLIQVESSINHPALRTFVASIFSDMAIAVPFLSAPGSLKHHHSELGGLMRHSIECAQITSSMPMLDDYHRDLACIGGLLHDIGKITSFDGMRRTDMGYLIDHQAATLEVCAAQLRELDKNCPDAALALRHILTCRSIKRWGYEPRMAIAHLVQLADRFSAELDMERQSFTGVNHSRNVSNRVGNAGLTFWRPTVAIPGARSLQQHA